MPDIMTREQRSERMSRVRNKNSKPETRVRSLLHRLGFRFRLYDAGLPGKPDIVLRRHDKVILMHGCYWHRHGVCRPLSIPDTNPDFWRKKFAEIVSRLACPDDADLPVGFAEGGDLVAIAADVVLELPDPEVRDVRGDGRRYHGDPSARQMPWRCQKQPCIRMTYLCQAKTISGLRGSFRLRSRTRKPGR